MLFRNNYWSPLSKLTRVNFKCIKTINKCYSTELYFTKLMCFNMMILYIYVGGIR